MPRFHFNVYDGVTLLDRDGTEYSSWEEARTQAICYCGEIFKGTAQCIALGEDWRMEVTDDQGLILLRIDFTVIASAALLSRQVTKGKTIGSAV